MCKVKFYPWENWVPRLKITKEDYLGNKTYTVYSLRYSSFSPVAVNTQCLGVKRLTNSATLTNLGFSPGGFLFFLKSNIYLSLISDIISSSVVS